MSSDDKRNVVVNVHQAPSRQSQALPALVNAFCFPGLGQLIQGRLLAAIVWWCLHLLAALSISIGIGLILWPIVWLLCVLDAARYQPQGVARSQTSGALRAIFAIVAAIVIVPIAIFAVGGFFAAREAAREGSELAEHGPDQTREPIASGEPNSGTREEVAPDQEIASMEPVPDDHATAEPVGEPESETRTDGGVSLSAETPTDESALDYRTWTDSAGQYTVEAQFITLIGGTVKLKRRDNGNEISLPMEKLSKEDQNWIAAKAIESRHKLPPKLIPEQERIEAEATQTSIPETVDVLRISAADLLAQYETNEVAADRVYKGKLVEVRGVVDNVGKDILGQMYVALKGGNEFGIFCVQCFFGRDWESALATVKPGYIYKIRGKCTGKLGNVLLKECEFAD